MTTHSVSEHEGRGKMSKSGRDPLHDSHRTHLGQVLAFCARPPVPIW